LSLVWTLASRNLFQDRLRFAATLIGIVFSGHPRGDRQEASWW